MENLKEMTFKELEDELMINHTEMRSANQERKRELISRDHELLTEMDARWEKIKDWYKK